jgi:hypothetical protein
MLNYGYSEAMVPQHGKHVISEFKRLTMKLVKAHDAGIAVYYPGIIT